MSNKNQIEIPEAQTELNKMKMEIASEIGVDLKSKNLTAKDAGRVGGLMTKKLIEQAKQNI